MDNTIYKKRRDNLEEILPNNSVLLLPGADPNIEMLILLMLLGKKAVFSIFLDFANLLH